MNASDLSEVLRLHTLWWKGDSAGKRAYLSGANLSGAYLSGADLSRANLSRANLLGVTGSPLPGLYLLKFQRAETEIRAWKYLAEGVSPYQHIAYAVGKTYSVKDGSTDERILCDKGLNVATLDWCLADSVTKNQVEFLEVEFKAGDIIAVPLGTDGKFRVRKLKVLRKISREQAQAILNKQLAPLLSPKKEAA